MPRYVYRTIAVLLCALLFLAFAACGRDDGASPVKYQDGEKFTIAIAQTPDSFNPTVTKGGLSEEFFLLCYDTLWRLDEYGKPQASLAEDWSLSSDQLTWTIRLRKDAVFSDGTPVTAKDVLFSYDLMRHTETIYTDYFDGVTAIRCPDDYTVVISTSRVKSDMCYNPTPILPRHIWSAYEYSPRTFDNAQMVGSGPFVYDAEGSQEGGWLFRAVKGSAAGTAKIGSVYFSLYGTVTGAARAMAAGEADASFGLSDVQLMTLEGVPGVDLVQAMLPSAEVRMLAFNMRTEFFELPTMRQMVEYCTDRSWFLAMSSGGAGQTGSSFLSPWSSCFSGVANLRGFDQNAATNYLRSVGYVDVDNDGILEYGVRENELILSLYSSGEDPWAATAATILSGDLTEVGINLKWNKTDLPVASVCGPRDNWDMCLYTWRGSLSTATTAARFLKDIGALTGWSSDMYSSLLAQLQTTMDEGTERAIAQQMQQLVYDDSPVIVLSYSADIQAIRSSAWTGCEELVQQGRGMFRTGSASVYLNIEPQESVG